MFAEIARAKENHENILAAEEYRDLFELFLRVLRLQSDYFRCASIEIRV